MKQAYELFGISAKIAKIAETVEDNLKEKFNEYEDVALYNQAKVLNAFKEANISQMHFGKTTGYGYGDIGREAIEKIYSQVFHTEDSLVRVQFVNGTHAIATTLKAMLMPGDTMLAITGRPYDTLCEVIGINENPKSLKSYGILYHEISLLENDDIDIQSVVKYLKENKVKMIHIQRSRGYALRKAFRTEELKTVIEEIRKVDSSVIIMVDNCYGEFVEIEEPTDVGADIICGSLIKNIGGGLCETGGYITGRSDLIELCGQTLTCPGIGKECGATMGQNRNILQGLFMAPEVTKNALKAATFAAGLFQELGYDIFPDTWADRADIVQSIKFGDKEKLIKFIQGIQAASPVDSKAVPYPWDMPGYDSQVIMAAGTFIEGASIELSADSPIREPYVAYMQGGLTYESAKLAICSAVENMLGDE
ncbi:MAG: aminotransferase class I/II-fold pyridoxal phosphate-dependent enzyme [Clostridia bacterium]|nr:aminotransferase class I/II-fold pyridoxal phosphate-dependent enzyme [Clostridia bacterium]